MPSDAHQARAIIGRLKNADSLHYSELFAAVGGDRDLFNYHLRELVAKGIVRKLPDRAGYALSAKGQRRVADVYHTSDQANRLFKINVLLIVVDRRADGLYVLNQRRTAQPDYGIVGIPGGTILKTEPLLAGASRKLREETGLSAEFEYLALTRRMIFDADDQLYADVLFPLCLDTSFHGDSATTLYGEPFWAPIDQAITNEADRIAAIPQALRAIRDDQLDQIRGRYFEQIVHRAE